MRKLDFVQHCIERQIIFLKNQYPEPLHYENRNNKTQSIKLLEKKYLHLLSDAEFIQCQQEFFACSTIQEINERYDKMMERLIDLCKEFPNKIDTY